MNRTELLNQLDAEINRLQQARRILGAKLRVAGFAQTGAKRRGPRHLSAEARRRIFEAQRPRWAKVKTSQQRAGPTLVTTKGRKRKGMSAEGRARIAAAQRKRWAKQRKAAA